MTDINEALGRLRTGKSTGVCERCKMERPNGELNYEAMVHHGAKKVLCLGRKDCERRRKHDRRKVPARTTRAPQS